MKFLFVFSQQSLLCVRVESLLSEIIVLVKCWWLGLWNWSKRKMFGELNANKLVTLMEECLWVVLASAATMLSTLCVCVTCLEKRGNEEKDVWDTKMSGQKKWNLLGDKSLSFVFLPRKVRKGKEAKKQNHILCSSIYQTMKSHAMIL